jgi:hypothetical protein
MYLPRLQNSQNRANTLHDLNFEALLGSSEELGGQWLGRGVSRREIDRHQNSSNVNGRRAVKTFAVSRSGSFRRICLRQTGTNHYGNNRLVLNAFEVFSAIAGLQQSLK